ncbi:MAG: GTP cyclohydrolase [Deltaproteobacteria bacterium RBG_16_48_10]|nr:MAG: GTP cyclohydrolase [Deltaproteobacteria bacterium RBG_16_48_10]
MNDIQNQRDHRKIEINKVGVKNIRYPIAVLDKVRGVQHTVASINMYVDLPHHFKGTHMSRFIEILNRFKGDISIKNFSNILSEMKRKLKAKSAHLEVEFSYFIEKEAPVTRARSLMEYICRFCGSTNEKDDFYVGIIVPITTVCPCSKEISQFGAHNQRSIVTVNLRFKKFIWIEDIIELIEECASCDLYSILKRPDEKFVTEKAYRNPMFVEDVVREIAKRLKKDSNITWFTVESENFESIHNHSAYAFVEKGEE